MAELRVLGDKVVGIMTDGYGEKVTAGGIITKEKDGDAKSIRPRWFEVTHVGADNKDFNVGDYILVEHGRWTRGFRINPTDKKKSHMIDLEKIIAVSSEPQSGY